MLVQQILASKGSGQVITVTPETSVADVTLVLSKHRIPPVWRILSVDWVPISSPTSSTIFCRSEGNELNQDAFAIM